MTRLLPLSALCALCSLALSLPAATLASGKTLTAFEAQEIAAKQVPDDSQKRLIQVRGERSDTNLTPDTWRFLFYDELADQHGRQVSVTGKAVSGIRDGYFELGRLRLAAYKMEEIISPSKLKVDSDKALSILKGTNLLKSYSLSSVVYDLALDGDSRDPIWKLEVFVDDNGKERDLGYARISASSGAILTMKFKSFAPAQPKSS